mmetsp:Transcript_30457/g.76468  ORF Transcript_30457/g.76468 Transcript_30457/m.76468 type:complete len:261 (-) Transcript_30457:26-808(-)
MSDLDDDPPLSAFKCQKCDIICLLSAAHRAKLFPYDHNRTPRCEKCGKVPKRFCSDCEATFLYSKPVSHYDNHRLYCAKAARWAEEAQEAIREKHAEERQLLGYHEADDLALMEEEETSGIYSWNSSEDQVRVQVASKIQRRDPGQQRHFAAALWKRDGKCLVSGCCLSACVDAAHISGSWRDGYDLDNGILLRKDLHALFDDYEWSIDVDTCKVHLGTNMLLDPQYVSLSNRKVDLSLLQDKNWLKDHYQRYFGNKMHS